MGKSNTNTTPRQDVFVDPTTATSYLSAGNWFPFRRTLLAIGLSNDEALILQHLINVQDYQQKAGDWFVCTTDDLETDLFQSRRVQVRVLGLLSSKGYVKCEKRGVPPKRHVWIDIQKIANEVHDYETRSSINTERCRTVNTERCRSLEEHKREDSSLRSLTRTRGEKRRERANPDANQPRRLASNDSLRSSDPQHIDWANRLHTVVRQTSRMSSIRGWSLRDWADEFRLLQKKIGTDDAASRIEHALAWYEQNAANKDLIAPIKSASAFRDRFDRDLEEKSLGQHWAQQKGPAAPKTVKVSDEAAALADELREGRDWQKGSDEELDAVVQLSLDAATPFAAALRRLQSEIACRDGLRPNTGVIVTLEAFYGECVGKSAKRIVQRYLRVQHKRLHSWPDWTGSLKHVIFDPKSEHVKKWITSFALESCGHGQGQRVAKIILEAGNEGAK